MGAGILGGGKAIFGGSQHLGQAHLSGGLGHAFLGNDNQGECILGVGTHILAIKSIGLQEGAVGVLSELLETLIQHHAHHALHIVCSKVIDAVLGFLLYDVMLEVQLNNTELLFHILVDGNDRLVVVGDGEWHHLGCIGSGRGNVLEQVLDFGLDIVHVDVTNNDQRLVVGAVPLIVVVAKHLIGEIIHYVHRTDDVALGILRAREQGLHLAAAHAVVGIATQAPLLVDHAALLVNLLIGEQQTVAPVLKDEHARVHYTLVGGWHIADDVNGLGVIGVGVVVALRLEVVIDAMTFAVEVFTAVKGHVLQEVCQAILVILFLHGTHALGDVEVGTLFRVIVVTDVVRQAVVQLADAHGRVDG